MRLLLLVGATIGLIGCSSAQDDGGSGFPHSEKTWQDDGSGGKVYNDNPNYRGPRQPTSDNGDDGASTFNRPNPKFEAKIPRTHDTGKQ